MELVYVPATQDSANGRWCRPSQCVWEGGQYLKRTPALKPYFEELRDFFHIILRVDNETLATVEMELRQLQASDQLGYILDLFKAISNYAEKEHGHTHSNISFSLKEHRIFPVTNTVLAWTFESLKSGLGNEIWFIADRHHLWKSFDGVVPLLAFGVDDIGRISPALRAMGLENRLLSKRVEDVTMVRGNSRLHPRYTASLRRKAKFIIRYIFPLYTLQRRFAYF